VVLYSEAPCFGHFGLTPLDLGIVELLDVPAFDADDVIVMAALLQLENGFPGFEVVPDEQSRLLELREHAINRRKARVRAFLDERFVNVLGRKVTNSAFFENFQDAQARRRRFEADRFEVSRRAQGGTLGSGELSYSESLPLKTCDAVLPLMFRSLVTLVVVLLLEGCQSVTGIPGLSAYKIDIQQGNYVTQDMVAKLKPGMTRSQVKFALGTPLVTDAFHPDRWDYVYVLNKKGKLIEQRRIIVVFKDDKLLRLEGDVVPAPEAASSAAEAPAANKLPQKSPESKPAESKPAENKPAENKPAENKPAENKAAENKPAGNQAAEGKPAEAAASVTP
jgi:outer membrane protein assembly factor BamE